MKLSFTKYASMSQCIIKLLLIHQLFCIQMRLQLSSLPMLPPIHRKRESKHPNPSSTTLFIEGWRVCGNVPTSEHLIYSTSVSSRFTEREQGVYTATGNVTILIQRESSRTYQITTPYDHLRIVYLLRSKMTSNNPSYGVCMPWRGVISSQIQYNHTPFHICAFVWDIYSL